MWVFTIHGFFSVVKKDKNSDMLVVRARTKDDLTAIRRAYFNKMGKTVANAGTDYPYRASIKQSDFAQGMVKVANDITYSNFKDEVHDRQGDFRADVYSKVWGNLYDLELREKSAKKTIDQFGASRFRGMYHD